MPEYQEFQKTEVLIIYPQQTEHRKLLARGVSEEHVKPGYAEVGTAARGRWWEGS